MKKSTLVHVTAGENGVSLRTVNRSHKSPHGFYIMRQQLADLENMPEIIVHDINSFAVLRRDAHADTVEIELTWLNSNGCNVTGRLETVVLSYDKLAVFLHDSAAGGHAEWKTLSLDDSRKRPQIVFKSRKNLHAALANRVVRHKLVRYLRDGFCWPCSDKIELFDDFLPYSFFFNEIRNGETFISGGLILHRQEDLKKAYYSVHT